MLTDQTIEPTDQTDRQTVLWLIDWQPTAVSTEAGAWLGNANTSDDRTNRSDDRANR